MLDHVALITGNEGKAILDMAAGWTNRAATVTTALGYADAEGVRVFEGTLQGTLTRQQRGDGGFGYDSIFIPAGSDRTFAEMSAEEKNRVSHRRLAVDALRKGLDLKGGSAARKPVR